MDLSSVPRLSSDLIWRNVDEGTVVISSNDGKVIVFNDVGAFVWSVIDGHNNVAQIADIVCEKYDVQPDQALTDVSAFLTDLQDRSLLA